MSSKITVGESHYEHLINSLIDHINKMSYFYSNKLVLVRVNLSNAESKLWNTKILMYLFLIVDIPAHQKYFYYANIICHTTMMT